MTLHTSEAVVVVAESVFTIILALLLVWQIKGLRSRYSSLVAISSITTNALLFFASFIALSEHMIEYYTIFDIKGCLLENIYFLFLMSGRTVVYCYWLSRCFQIFNGSIFRLKRKLIIVNALILMLPNFLITRYAHILMNTHVSCIA